MRRLLVIAVASLPVAVFQATPAVSSPWEEARKICLERYNDEVRSGTVPNRMTKSRYLNQCQASYVRSAKLEDELEEAMGADAGQAQANSPNGQGGPEDLVRPATQPARNAAPARPVRPTPRFKPGS
jgi:hypothetical protein